MGAGAAAGMQGILQDCHGRQGIPCTAARFVPTNGSRATNQSYARSLFKLILIYLVVMPLKTRIKEKLVKRSCLHSRVRYGLGDGLLGSGAHWCEYR